MIVMSLSSKWATNSTDAVQSSFNPNYQAVVVLLCTLLAVVYFYLEQHLPAWREHIYHSTDGLWLLPVSEPCTWLDFILS